MAVFTFDELCKSQGFDYNGDDVIAALSHFSPLAKALGTTDPGGSFNSPRLSPLQLENLDGLMTEVLISEKHFKLFNSIPRTPSPTPYFEWNRHKGFGSRRGSIGFAEGGAPKGSLSTFIRSGLYNKYYGVQGGVTHQMMIAGQNGGTVEDPETREKRDRALELFERLEREFIFGDSTINDEAGNAVHFDGLLKQLTSGNGANVIDLAGQPLTFNNLDSAARTLVKGGKQISVDGYNAYMSTHVLDGLNAQYKDRNIFRHNKDNAASAQYTPGFKLPGYETNFGTFAFEHTILLEEVEDSAPLAASSGTGIGAVAAATGVAASGGALDAATYYYKIAAYNDTGETVPGTASAGIAATAGQKITLTITAPSGNVTGYRIYRCTGSATGTYKWIGRAAKTDATDTFVDAGAWRTYDTAAATAGTPDYTKDQNGIAVLIKPDPRDIVMAQMAPLLSMPLPQVGTTFPFLLLLYCVLVLKAPERVIIFKNAGQYTPV